jgi:hypothetical protein
MHQEAVLALHMIPLGGRGRSMKKPVQSPRQFAIPILRRERERPRLHLDGLTLIALVDLQGDLCSWRRAVVTLGRALGLPVVTCVSKGSSSPYYCD